MDDPLTGWDVKQIDKDRWRARRRGGLTPAQIDRGCKLVVTASDLGELRRAAAAENIKLTLIEAADGLDQAMIAAEHRRQGRR